MNLAQFLDILNTAVADNPELGECKIYTDALYDVNFNEICKPPAFGFTKYGQPTDFNEESEHPNALLIKL